MVRIYSLLLTGVLIVSTSSLLVRWAGAVPFAVIAFYRVFISVVVLVPVHIWLRKGSDSTLQQVRWQYIVAGFFLAGHFVAWIASLQMTTIANSIFLQGTHPLFAALFSSLFLKEPPQRFSYPFFFLAGLGMYLIVSADMELAYSKTLGDLLAVSSAVLIALYLMIARIFKTEVDLIKYLVQVYGAASVFCLLYVMVGGDRLFGFSSLSWAMIILLALGPNLMGHSLLNWASRHIEIYKVNLTLLLEPVLATLGGMVFMKEFPGISFYLGAGLIILSVGLLVYVENKSALPLEQPD